MDPISKKLKVIVVIPCLAENRILDTLESLKGNSGFGCLVECWVIVNHSEAESEEKKSLNFAIVKQLKETLPTINSKDLRFELIEAFDLPAKKAGVGIARKIGMDNAVERFKQAGTFTEGTIVCLDGDCIVAENYLAEIERFIEPSRNGCSIYFEHSLDAENSKAIIDYELYLRYYTNALRWCGFPFAFQTVGSSMAVSATAYVKQGGMNTRKAGEDFYFLNKVIQLGAFADLNTTTVYPSPRKSDRVPFGTGREMMEWEISRQLMAYNPILIKELKKFCACVDSFRSCKDPGQVLTENKIHETLINYLSRQNIADAIQEISAHTASIESFRKRFFVWINAFQTMKLLNELSAMSLPKIPIQECATWLWGEVSDRPSASTSRDLLLQFREFDRNNPGSLK